LDDRETYHPRCPAPAHDKDLRVGMGIRKMHIERYLGKGGCPDIRSIIETIGE